MNDFESALGALVAKELSDAAGDSARMGVAIETVLRSAGLVIAVAGRGNPKNIDELLKGADSYLCESAVGFAKVAAFMASARPVKR